MEAAAEAERVDTVRGVRMLMRGGQLGGGYWVSGEQGRPGWLRFMRVPGCVLRIGIRTRLLRERDLTDPLG